MEYQQILKAGAYVIRQGFEESGKVRVLNGIQTISTNPETVSYPAGLA
jgi:hypothetical protein